MILGLDPRRFSLPLDTQEKAAHCMSSCRSCANEETRREEEEAVHCVSSYRGAAIARLESASSFVVVSSSFFSSSGAGCCLPPR
jgi:hypothetical protein